MYVDIYSKCIVLCVLCKSKQEFGMFKAGVFSGLAFTVTSVKMHNVKVCNFLCT